jgi:signal transduction histidine kinase
MRMSRAIHDTLLQGLAALALQIDDLSHTFESPSICVKDRLLRIRKRIEEDVRQARQSIFDLRSPRLESVGLLQRFARPRQRTAGTTGRWRSTSPSTARRSPRRRSC